MGKTSECLSWEQRGRDQAQRSSQGLLTSLETNRPPASKAADCPHCLLPGPALSDLAGPSASSVLPSCPRPVHHTACGSVRERPVSHHTSPSYCKRGHPPRACGLAGLAPHILLCPPQPPEFEPLRLDACRLAPPFGLSVSTSRLPSGPPGPCGSRPSPEGTVSTAGHRGVCPSSAVSAAIPQLGSSGRL